MKSKKECYNMLLITTSLAVEDRKGVQIIAEQLLPVSQKQSGI
jgi:hypothetical protein